MKEKIYHSTDKLYKMKKRKLSKRAKLMLNLIFTLIILVLSIISFMGSVILNEANSDVKYNEIGKVDYKVYLKDNDYYDSSYLNSGMQYVASLIKTVNVKFDYQMHSTKDMLFDYNYKVIGELIITERDDPTKVLYTKKEELIKQEKATITDDNFIINEEIDIDYDKYNSIVNSYKKNLGLVVSSNLILTLETETNGNYDNDKFNKNSNLKITIPLSEATLNIKMDSNEINNSGSLGDSNKAFVISNKTLFIVSIFLTLVTIFSVVLDTYIYIKYFKKDIYKATVGKILRDYDRLIVEGKVNINESNFENVIIVEEFKELVDAAQNINQSILFYEAIPNEKCFFVVITDKVLYKYRLTKAFLENNSTKKTENKSSQTTQKKSNKKI